MPGEFGLRCNIGLSIQVLLISRLTISLPTLDTIERMQNLRAHSHSVVQAGGLQAASLFLSERPQHLPGSVTYLQPVSNKTNNMQHLNLSAVKQIE